MVGRVSRVSEGSINVWGYLVVGCVCWGIWGSDSRIGVWRFLILDR